MNFKEQFPSLNEEMLEEYTDYYPPFLEGLKAILCNHCLDKQKVREVIHRAKVLPLDSITREMLLNNILKELEL